MTMRLPLLAVAAVVSLAAPAPFSVAQAHEELIATHAAATGVPASLIRRVIQMESRGNARAVSKGNYGLMQIRLGTARAMGYSGDAQGLLDANTNMTYAVKYLAGAYRAAGGSEAGAIRNYQRGYYYAAKKQGFSPYQVAAASDTMPVLVPRATTGAAVAAEEPAPSTRRVRAQRAKDAQPMSLLPAFLTDQNKPARRDRRKGRDANAAAVPVAIAKHAVN